MRLRSAFTAVLGAALLLVTVPASASAASGRFSYTYLTVEGYEASGFLTDPWDGECFNLPGVGQENPEPGHSPRNRTDAWATVFGDTNCEGPAFRLRPHTGWASERLKVRSVVFG
ncbi:MULTISPECIES: hypothetical protein [unclassified Streptomyces]|uniref:hypothetical protein n=1 Tax=unclassified Streptomyces TaxID=2593676 RepID=UPI0004AA9394|nr:MULTISPECIES: hypothetical protein [unclassified Streptomyces]APU42164.1 hypothetical protein BSL84_22690 [Streptomyces sp. TN58]KJK45446.1 hypothetical protein UK14_26040 [Streptomyces sp. NRRL F-4428]